MRTLRLQVTLREVAPRVLRVIDVPEASTLPELHELLQVAIGWTDSHLHQFDTGGTRYGVSHEEWDDDQQDEATVRLRDLPDRFVYLYDFGDGWTHDVEVLGPGGDQPGCVYGEGTCPPEDCGGPHGHAELLAVLADPQHDDHERMRDWAGELAPFDQAATDLLVRRTTGMVPPSVRLILDVVADGVTLTPGGRLPRAVVRQVQEDRPQWHLFGRPASREDDLLPLVALHDLMRDIGLLRLARGVLRPTRAAANELEVVRRLRSWFPPGEFTSLLASDVVAMLAAAGPLTADDLAARLHPGYIQWSCNGQPLTQHDVSMSMHRLAGVLQALDQVTIDWPHWSAGPAALTLLSRATALAEIWTNGRHRILAT
jgi:Plasmid pRiA4b ORF-3-like protein